MSGRTGKIFGIGLSKTGTTSLTAALSMLGYSTVHYPSPRKLIAGDFDFLDEFDVATDTPITAFFPILDQRYPGSRFILTHREEEAWVESIRKHFGRIGSHMEQGAMGTIREMIYGRRQYDEAHFRSVYHKHTAWVREHFRDRPEALLEIDIPSGDGWEKLCPFLGKEIPNRPFPKRNIRPDRMLDEKFYTRTISGPGIDFGRKV